MRSIETIIKLAKQIYEEYKSIYELTLKYEKNSNESLKEVINSKLEIIRTLKQAEDQEYDTVISNGKVAQEIFNTLIECYFVENDGSLEDYISEPKEHLMPIKRILMKLEYNCDDLFDDFEPKDYAEDYDALFQSKAEIEAEKEAYKDFGITEMLHSLYYEEAAVKFMNCVEEELKDKKLKKYYRESFKELKRVKYDLTYLIPTLENLYIGDRLLLPNNILFDTCNLFYNYVNIDDITFIANRQNYFEEEALCCIKNLSTGRKNRNDFISKLRTIYLKSIVKSFEEDEYDDFIVNYEEEIKNCPYDHIFISELKESIKEINTIMDEKNTEEVKEQKNSKTQNNQKCKSKRNG